MEYESKDVEDFIRNTINSIKKGVGEDNRISGDIKFELAIVKTQKVEGKFKIFVVDAEGRYSKEKITVVTFKVNPKRFTMPGGVNF